jgi:hypothetical protein
VRDQTPRVPNGLVRRIANEQRAILSSSPGAVISFPVSGRALLRQRDGLDRKRAGVLLLVVADDVRQLTFRDPRGIADLCYRDGFGEAVLDGLDLGLFAFYRARR